jgi:hypothetical protein
MRTRHFILIALLLGLMALSGCNGTVSVGVAVGSPYGYGPYGPSYHPYGPYGPYGTVRVGTGPIIW